MKYSNIWGFAMACWLEDGKVYVFEEIWNQKLERQEEDRKLWINI